MALTEAHAAARMKGIGGSELATILHKEVAASGDTVYGCPLALYFEKTGVEADYPFPETGPIQRGVALEGKVAGLYYKDTGHKIRKLAHKTSKERPWEMVSIDRQIIGEPEGTGVLECKTVGRERWFQIKGKGLPLGFVLQVQWGLYVLGPQYNWGAVALLWADGWEHPHFRVERDQALIDMMAKKVAAFWRLVEAKTPPKKLKYKDPRCQECLYGPTCQGKERLEAAGQDIDSFEEIEVADELGPKVRLRMELKKIENDAKEQCIDVAGQIIEGMGDRLIVSAGGYRVVRKEIKGGLIIDSPRMKRDAPEVFEEWSKKKKDSWRLNFYAI